MRYDITLVTTQTGYTAEIYDNEKGEWLPERKYKPTSKPTQLLRQIDEELNK
ncbi:hypothetical protein HOR53_gp04 [Pectobacterium phage PP99]|uniref:Uncharacterized protein n=1 Tax=Pectobacterium phage PP99 TaxID=1932883 RepID=A0A1P8L622_9CAUD|nr:hypothetical protein HOR53_gp04 [Pectobacterium phage PP99]APW79697.1 hypothetical protein PP99_04 [Pectobacterium phage PP99]